MYNTQHTTPQKHCAIISMSTIRPTKHRCRTLAQPTLTRSYVGSKSRIYYTHLQSVHSTVVSSSCIVTLTKVANICVYVNMSVDSWRRPLRRASRRRRRCRRRITARQPACRTWCRRRVTLQQPPQPAVLQIYAQTSTQTSASPPVRTHHRSSSVSMVIYDARC